MGSTPGTLLFPRWRIMNNSHRTVRHVTDDIGGGPGKRIALPSPGPLYTRTPNCSRYLPIPDDAPSQPYTPAIYVRTHIPMVYKKSGVIKSTIDLEEGHMLHPDQISRSNLPISQSNVRGTLSSFPSPLAAMGLGNPHYLHMAIGDMMAS
jgi:hypothetical protein